MNDFGVKLIEFSNTSPIFKGGATTLVGILALVFVLWFMKKTGRKWEVGQKVFLVLAVFIVLYGLFILIFQPHWWNPPYELPSLK
jgi:heme/copper-type cytochrome/quinol oxidase subunit 4